VIISSLPLSLSLVGKRSAMIELEINDSESDWRAHMKSDNRMARVLSRALREREGVRTENAANSRKIEELMRARRRVCARRTVSRTNEYKARSR